MDLDTLLDYTDEPLIVNMYPRSSSPPKLPNVYQVTQITRFYVPLKPMYISQIHLIHIIKWTIAELLGELAQAN